MKTVDNEVSGWQNPVEALRRWTVIHCLQKTARNIASDHKLLASRLQEDVEILQAIWGKPADPPYR